MKYFEYPATTAATKPDLDKCGICELMKKLDLFDLDSGNMPFGLHHERGWRRNKFRPREYTLASGGP